jgi:hypothetical protein
VQTIGCPAAPKLGPNIRPYANRCWGWLGPHGWFEIPIRVSVPMAIYEVPGITLIPQPFTMSCWYASAQMLVQWRQYQAQASLAWLVPPEFDAQCRTIRDADSGLQNSQLSRLQNGWVFRLCRQ